MAESALARKSQSPLAKRMKLKAGSRAAVVNAPAGYLKELAPLPAGVDGQE